MFICKLKKIKNWVHFFFFFGTSIKSIFKQKSGLKCVPRNGKERYSAIDRIEMVNINEEIAQQQETIIDETKYERNGSDITIWQ